MIFWISLLGLVIGIVLVVLYDTCTLRSDVWNIIGCVLLVFGIVAVLICCIILVTNYLGVDGQVASYQQQYESLTYQHENNLYDNDNDLGKKELLNEIQDWNTDLAWRKANQRDFWIGIFIPNIYDQFEFIPLSLIK